MTGPRQNNGDDGVNLILGAGAALLAVAAVQWLGGGLAAFVSGHGWPHARLLAGLAAFAHAGDPSTAWHAPVGPAVCYWLVQVVLLALLAAAAWLGWRLLHRTSERASDPQSWPGFASRVQVRRAVGAKVLLAKGKTLRPTLAEPTATELGFRLGRSRGLDCWVSVADSVVVLGPPRSGAGLHVVTGMILDAPGAVLTTATGMDNLTTTLRARESLGPVAVFDPQHLAGGAVPALRWSPVRGCASPQVALTRARALTAGLAGDANAPAQQCFAAVRCLLHAAALAHSSTLELYRWSLHPAAAREAVDVLTAHPNAAPAWDRALAAIFDARPGHRDAVWALVARTFAALADPRVLDALSPGTDEHFDPAEFMRWHGTLYLLDSSDGPAATAGLVTALAEDVLDAARRLAAGSPGARLDPPLTVLLDDAAHYRLPSLPALLGEDGRCGIPSLVVLPSLAQARQRWGRDTADAVWDAATTRLVLGGSGDPQPGLDLAGLDAARLRTLASGYGVLLRRPGPAIMLGLLPWTERPDAGALRASREQLRTAIQYAHTPPADGVGIALDLNP